MLCTKCNHLLSQTLFWAYTKLNMLFLTFLGKPKQLFCFSPIAYNFITNYPKSSNFLNLTLVKSPSICLGTKWIFQQYHWVPLGNLYRHRKSITSSSYDILNLIHSDFMGTCENKVRSWTPGAYFIRKGNFYPVCCQFSYLQSESSCLLYPFTDTYMNFKGYVRKCSNFSNIRSIGSWNLMLICFINRISANGCQNIWQFLMRM